MLDVPRELIWFASGLLGALRELGIAVPAADRLAADLDRQFGYVYRWLGADIAGDLARPQVTDPALLAVGRLIDAVGPAANYFATDLAMPAWLSLEAVRIWLEHGPGSSLIGPAGYAAYAAVTLRNDYAAGYQTARRLVTVGEALGYEPGTSQSWFGHLACWFEPIENAVQPGQRAREGLIAGGDLVYAGFTYYQTVSCLLDCAPTLEGFAAEVEAGRAFARRTGNEHVGQWLDSYRWLAGVLRGEGSAAASAGVPAANPGALAAMHGTGVIAAAIFGDQAALARHAAAALPLLPTREGRYSTAVARMLRGLARAADGEERADLLAELAEVTRWLAERAADAPDNFLHLLRLLEAERAWADGDYRAATLAFDAARREVAVRQWPWHQAPITERAARFSLAHGLDQAGHDLLAQARQQYFAWGATAKAAQLDWAYPAVHPQPGGRRGRCRAARRSSRRPRRGHHRNDRPARHRVRLAGAELTDQHRSAARHGGRGARRDDRGHRRAPGAMEPRTAGLAAASIGRGRHCPGRPPRPPGRRADAGAAVRAADRRAASRQPPAWPQGGYGVWAG